MSQTHCWTNFLKFQSNNHQIYIVTIHNLLNRSPNTYSIFLFTHLSLVCSSSFLNEIFCYQKSEELNEKLGICETSFGLTINQTAVEWMILDENLFGNFNFVIFCWNLGDLDGKTCRDFKRDRNHHLPTKTPQSR